MIKAGAVYYLRADPDYIALVLSVNFTYVTLLGYKGQYYSVLKYKIEEHISARKWLLKYE